jgi:hypothetical protein
VERIPTSNITTVERDKINTPNTKIRHRSFSWIGTGTSVKDGGVKLVW